VKELPRPASLPPKPRELKIENVSFGYSREQRVLKGIDARIAPGEMVAFLGRSGVGKSTLLNLLPRFYDPLEGCVRLDGEPLPVLCIADLRGHIALVSQETPVIAGTIAGNIAYGRPDAAFSEIVRAAEMAGAADFIAELPGKYDAPVGEGGFNFSGGQRQRLAIARAFLSDAPILILDEPTSALDVLHEQTVMESLQKLRGQRTIVLVTHRVVTVETCDQIFVMDEGLIVETGTHMQLMTRGGLYSRLLRAASPDV
jgi:ABC-type multidrug transport system fused ATPase/permease subunit